MRQTPSDQKHLDTWSSRSEMVYHSILVQKPSALQPGAAEALQENLPSAFPAPARGQREKPPHTSRLNLPSVMGAARAGAPAAPHRHRGTLSATGTANATLEFTLNTYFRVSARLFTSRSHRQRDLGECKSNDELAN